MADNNKNEQEIRGKYMELQGMKPQLEKLNENLQNIDEQLEQISQNISNLKEIHKLEKGTEILVPVSNGIFMKAKIEDNKQFIANMGSNTAVTKNLDKLVEIMLSQEKELIELRERMAADHDHMKIKAITLQTELQEMMK